MFEPLSSVIRLRRLQRNLTQERLAKLAGVSRRQLSLMEDGANVSLLFLTKIARVLELTEIPIGELRLRAAPPELDTVVRANEVLERLKVTLPQWEAAADEIRNAAESLDGLLARALAAPTAGDAAGAADDLASLPAGERKAAGETLRSLGGKKSADRVPRPKPAAASTARRRKG